MENASKALIMAGSVLLAVLIIGMLVFMFNQLSDLKATEENSEEAQKLVEYNKQIESFINKTSDNGYLYGSEILSLANLVSDYKVRQAGAKGYKEIKFEVSGIAEIEGYIKSNYNSGEEITNDFEKLEEEINNLKKNYTIGNNSVSKLYGMKDWQLKQVLEGVEEYKADANTIIGNKNSGNPTGYSKLDEVFNALEQYANLYTSMRTFKNTKFKLSKDPIYDENTGRIIEIKFQMLN